MRYGKLGLLLSKIMQTLPSKLQKIINKVLIETKLAAFKMRLILRHQKTTDPTRIYFISPMRIAYHTNYLQEGKTQEVPFRARTFPPEMRGSAVDGNWDLSYYKFTDLDIYKSFKKRIEERVKWENTDFYKRVLRQVESGTFVWKLRNKDEVDKRFEYLDWLIASIKNRGYILNRNNYFENATIDEIDVNIGRNGDYLFQNGVHRLSIAKILGIKQVPVTVFVRHKKWQEFRDFVISYAQHQKEGMLYQPIIHPDLADIPHATETHDYSGLMVAIKQHLGKESGVMLDIGANVGYFCHKFEDLGYKCYAVEQDSIVFQILKKIRTAENKKFEAINKSIFNVGFINSMEFDVVLALNIFHQFLKRKTEYFKLINLLKNLKTAELFFEPHVYTENQMKDAYVNYNETEFVDFLLKHTSLARSELIYAERSGRRVFKLSK